ncbi:hypothetical protein FA15DRAFT_554080, partial [Coprinopsis marcescibilis]
TFHNRWLNCMKVPKEAHDQMLLSPEAEVVLIDWIKFLGFVGRPVCTATIRPKVLELRGRYSGKHWL